MELEETRKLLDKVFHTIEIAQAQLDQDKVPPDNFYLAYSILGDNYRYAALYLLLLGDKREALTWFKKSTEYLKKSYLDRRSRQGLSESDSGVCVSLQTSSVLSSDKDIMLDVAKICLSLDKSYPEKYRALKSQYYYNRATSLIILGEDEKAKQIVDKIGGNRSFRKYHNGLRQCLEGILDLNKALVLDGLNLVLEDHDDEFKNVEVGPPYEMICVPATMLIKLAETRGIIIRPSDINDKYCRYIPWILFN